MKNLNQRHDLEAQNPAETAQQDSPQSKLGGNRALNKVLVGVAGLLVIASSTFFFLWKSGSPHSVSLQEARTPAAANLAATGSSTSSAAVAASASPSSAATPSSFFTPVAELPVATAAPSAAVPVANNWQMYVNA